MSDVIENDRPLIFVPRNGQCVSEAVVERLLVCAHLQQAHWLLFAKCDEQVLVQKKHSNHAIVHAVCTHSPSRVHDESVRFRGSERELHLRRAPQSLLAQTDVCRSGQEGHRLLGEKLATLVERHVTHTPHDDVSVRESQKIKVNVVELVLDLKNERCQNRNWEESESKEAFGCCATII